MGMFDSIFFKNRAGVEQELQFKNGECLLLVYKIGDKIELNDGVYFTFDGAFVVFGKIVVAAFDEKEPFLFDKWEGQMPYPDMNNWL